MVQEPRASNSAELLPSSLKAQGWDNSPEPRRVTVGEGCLTGAVGLSQLRPCGREGASGAGGGEMLPPDSPPTPWSAAGTSHWVDQWE